MTRIRQFIVAVSITALAATACGTGDQDKGKDSAAPSFSENTTAPTVDQSVPFSPAHAAEAAYNYLRLMAEGKYDRAYDYQSNRCRDMRDREAFIAEAQKSLAGRDLYEGNPHINIIGFKPPAVVVQTIRTNPDGTEREPEDRRWMLENDQWHYDSC
ncbi:Uncharacterised protein [Mycobacteroides abscessus subsp. massiliense]|uniref:hypothetical protein n=1 Tax=Mycobacteroides abscessus TaxID=36809 RepID=UPI0009A66846|nr:hypothetical protein [Mycobacteroides abscessus]SKU88394.1 Uncharacterised protein [Mycobacteroides abscessus subsp. massiliense]SKU96488.1 Uncharacterised protein [Mycobacteroides abscessus subsp. massiliense]